MKIGCASNPPGTPPAARRTRAGLCLLVALAWITLGVSPVGAYSGGIAGYAGAPDDPSGASFTCAVCHDGGSLTGGAFLLIPGGIVAGETVPIDVYYSGAAPQVWGFNLIAIDDSTGLPVGDLTAGTGSQILTSSDRGWEYLTHSPSGTMNTIGTPADPGWEIEWTAPPSAVHDVTFYLALNAADHNGNFTGDTIFTTTESITVPEPTRALGLPVVSLALFGLARRRASVTRGLGSREIEHDLVATGCPLPR